MSITRFLNMANSKGSIRAIVKYVGDNPTRFAELVKLLNSQDRMVAYTACWALGYCVEQHPKLLSKHFSAVINAAAMPNASDGMKRNALRALQFVTLPARHQGKAAHLCFKMLENKKEAVAIRVFAMTVLANICKQNPDLRNEVAALIEDGLPYAKPGYLSRAKKVLKQLQEPTLAKD